MVIYHLLTIQPEGIHGCLSWLAMGAAQPGAGTAGDLLLFRVTLAEAVPIAVFTKGPEQGGGKDHFWVVSSLMVKTSNG